IISLKPRRVLEIGCGTGLLLFRVAPHCESYHGTDLSEKALEHIDQHIAKHPHRYQNVTLTHQTADELSSLDSEAYDTLVINSVIQYFPSVDYLVRVLEEAERLVKPGGKIFLGDVRNRRLLDVLHTSVQIYNAQPSTPISQIRERADKESREEKELVLDPALFSALKSHLARISRVEIQLKRGTSLNELTQFRYDVILHIGNDSAPKPETQWLRWRKDLADLSALRQILNHEKPEALIIAELPNARVLDEVRTASLINGEAALGTVGELIEGLNGLETSVAVQPESLWRLGHETG